MPAPGVGPVATLRPAAAARFLHRGRLPEAGELFGRFLEPLEGVEVAVERIPSKGGDEEDVRVRDSPAPRIYAHELRLQRLHHAVGHRPSRREQSVRLLAGKIVPPRHMPLREHEAVASRERVDVEDYEGEVVLVDAMGRSLARDDVAEHAARGFVRHEQLQSTAVAVRARVVHEGWQ
jgi:hypothetical protein